MTLFDGNLLPMSFVLFWQKTLAVCGMILVLDTLIMSQLKGKHRAERSHYILCCLSIVSYIALYPLDSELFRQYWIQILTSLYLYDLCIIARDWKQLKHSYRVFYSVHHSVSLCLFVVWHYTFVPFTHAMALAALLWVSSDIWRWLEQLWRLSGNVSSDRLRDTVDYMERGHRLAAYFIYLCVLGFEFKHTSELILMLSGITMDCIDSYFVRKARNIRKSRRAQLQEPLPLLQYETHQPFATFKGKEMNLKPSLSKRNGTKPTT